MGTFTQNYNFYIPDGSEFGEIIKLVLEPNFTIADQQLKNLNNNKIDVKKIANNLTTEEEGYVLGAGQGKILDNKKFDKTGGTILGNITVTGTGVFNGHLTSQDEVTAFSDRILKTELKSISNAVDKVKKINGYTYKMLGNERRQAGVIAQEIEKVLPEVVVENQNGYLSVAYGNISALLIEAIKEIDSRLTKIENQLSGGKNEIYR